MSDFDSGADFKPGVYCCPTCHEPYFRDLVWKATCLECQHLQGYGAASWRCGNWQAAGIGINPRSTQLPAGLVFQLQRCNGFAVPTLRAAT